jgi:hypothetical protein
MLRRRGGDGPLAELTRRERFGDGLVGFALGHRGQHLLTAENPPENPRLDQTPELVAVRDERDRLIDGVTDGRRSRH